MSTRSSEASGQAPGDESVSIARSLLARVREQDGDAWDRLVQLFGPVVFGWCRRAGLQADDAADVGQDVFAAVAKSISRFRRERPGDTFRGWLWTITQYKLKDYWRARTDRPDAAGGTAAQRQLAQLAQDETNPAITSDDTKQPSGEFHRALELIRSDFEDRTWQAFWQTTIEKVDPLQVAETLGMSRGAVYTAKSRVLRRLRDEFDELLE